MMGPGEVLGLQSPGWCFDSPSRLSRGALCHCRGDVRRAQRMERTVEAGTWAVSANHRCLFQWLGSFCLLFPEISHSSL